MSRVANSPISLPTGVSVKLDGQKVEVKGPKGDLSLSLHETVRLTQTENQLQVAPADDSARAMAGTMRALVFKMVSGCV